MNIYVDKESFENKEKNFWLYQIDKLEEEWDIDYDDETLSRKAEEILNEHGIEIIEDDEYENMSEEEQEEDEKEFLRILYKEFEDFMTEHITFIIQKTLNVENDIYFYICFDLVAKEAENKTTLEKLHQWKNSALNHKYIIKETSDTILGYFEEYLLNDNYKDYVGGIVFYMKQWENVITHFLDSIINRIEECNRGKEYELCN